RVRAPASRRASRSGVGIPRERLLPSTAATRGLKVAPPGLLDLDRLEERLEVAHAKAARAVALDALVEERRANLHGSREDLEEVALLVAIGLDAELLERLDRDADVADPLGQLLVVGMGHAQELDAVLAQRADRADDVLRAQRDVLRPRLVVVVQELLD